MTSGENKRTEKLQLLLDDEELRAIDDWRFEHRMPSRAAAIRELLRRGLFYAPDSIPNSPDARVSSGDVRVVTDVEDDEGSQTPPASDT